MANYYSTPANFNNYIKPFDLELTNTVMAAKQQKFDYNQAKTEAMLGQVAGGLNLVREEDREYLNSRVQNLFDNLGSYGKINWSSDGVTRQLDVQIGEVIDDRVLQDVISTRNYNSFLAQAQDYRENEPEQYSDRNVAYSMSKGGVNSWLSGQSSKLGKVNYTPYTDVSSELKDISKNLDKYVDVIKHTTPQGEYFVTQEGEKLTPEKIENISWTLLSDRAKDQMQINGWYNYDRGQRTSQDISNSFNKLRLGKLDQFSSKINELKVNLKNEFDNNKKVQLQRQITELESAKNNLDEQYSNWIEKGDISNMTFTMERENVIGGFGKTFAKDTVATSYSANNAFIQMEKIKAKKYKEALDKNRQLSGGDLSELRPVVIGAEGLGERNLVREQQEKMENNTNSFRGSVLQKKNNLDAETQSMIDAKIAEAGEDASEEDIIFDELDRLSKISSNIVSIGEVENLRNIRAARDKSTKAFTSAIDNSIQDVERKSILRMVKAYREPLNYNIKMLVNGSSVSVGDYLRDNEINTEEDIQNNPEVVKNVLKSYYADKIATEGLRDVDPILLNRFKQLFDEEDKEITFKDGYTQQLPVYNPAIGRSEISNVVISKTLDTENSTAKGSARYLAEIQKRGLYDNDQFAEFFLPMPDSSVTDDVTLRRSIDIDEIEKGANTYLSTQQDLITEYAVEVRPDKDSEVFQSIAAAAENPDATEGSPITFDRRRSVSIRSISPDEVRVSQVTKTKQGDAPKSTIILKNRLPQELLSRVNLIEEDAAVGVEDLDGMEQQIIYGTSTDMRRLNDLAINVTGTQQAFQTTKEEMKTVFFRNYPQIMGGTQQPTNIGVLVNGILNSEDFKVVVKNNFGTISPSIINTRGGTDQTIFSYQGGIPQDRYSNVKKQIQYAPQLYMNGMIQTMLQDLSTSGYSPIYEKLSQIYNIQ